MNRIRCLLIKELVQLRRDPRLFRLLLIAPMIQLLVLGFAVNNDLREINLGVRDYDRSFQSRELVRALGGSGYFRIRHVEGPEAEDSKLLVSGKAGLIVVIPPGFSRDLLRLRTAALQVIVDGADSNFGVQGLNYLQKAMRQFSEGRARVLPVPRLRESGLPLPSVRAQVRVWFNPDLRSQNFMVPALMAQLLMITTMLVTSMALVKEREQGTLEQLVVTPLRPLEMIVGKLLPFVVVGFVEVTLALPLMLLVFDVPFRGNLLFLYGMSGLYLLTTLGLGLFISTLVKTQQQAMMAAMFFVMLPFLLLSGFAFPVENMPRAIQPIAYGIPLTYYLTALRGVFLKGTGPGELWPEAVILLGWGAGILALAALKFRKRLG
jgi:ABC-2 type transport system permease protein